MIIILLNVSFENVLSPIDYQLPFFQSFFIDYFIALLKFIEENVFKFYSVSYYYTKIMIGTIAMEEENEKRERHKVNAHGP